MAITSNILGPRSLELSQKAFENSSLQRAGYSDPVQLMEATPAEQRNYLDTSIPAQYTASRQEIRRVSPEMAQQERLRKAAGGFPR